MAVNRMNCNYQQHPYSSLSLIANEFENRHRISGSVGEAEQDVRVHGLPVGRVGSLFSCCFSSFWSLLLFLFIPFSSPLPWLHRRFFTHARDPVAGLLYYFSKRRRRSALCGLPIVALTFVDMKKKPMSSFYRLH